MVGKFFGGCPALCLAGQAITFIWVFLLPGVLCRLCGATFSSVAPSLCHRRAGAKTTNPLDRRIGGRKLPASGGQAFCQPRPGLITTAPDCSEISNLPSQIQRSAQRAAWSQTQPGSPSVPTRKARLPASSSRNAEDRGEDPSRGPWIRSVHACLRLPAPPRLAGISGHQSMPL